MKKAVVLLSGGLDSATILAIAKIQNFHCYALSFFYGQRHKIELELAKKLSQMFKVIEHKIIKLDLGNFGGSSLTSDTKVQRSKIYLNKSFKDPSSIPNTYVPARNTLFLSYALSYAEIIGSCNIFIGVNAVDYSNYPDSRPKYIEAFNNMANLATKAAINGQKLKVHAPLINMTKAQIILTGLNLGVDYACTHSCYNPKEGRACGECDSCVLRKRGFIQAGIKDPIKYQCGKNQISTSS